MLLQKPGKLVRNPTSFWPLYMLDMIGKIFEQVVAEQLRKHFWGKCALRANQYGFRAGCSTINAARKIIKFDASTIKKRQFDAAVSLDIQNAFVCNSAMKKKMIQAGLLQRHLQPLKRKPRIKKKGESAVTPSVHASKQWRNGDRKVACLKGFPLAPMQAR